MIGWCNTVVIHGMRLEPIRVRRMHLPFSEDSDGGVIGGHVTGNFKLASLRRCIPRHGDICPSVVPIQVSSSLRLILYSMWVAKPTFVAEAGGVAWLGDINSETRDIGDWNQDMHFACNNLGYTNSETHRIRLTCLDKANHHVRYICACAVM